MILAWLEIKDIFINCLGPKKLWQTEIISQNHFFAPINSPLTLRAINDKDNLTFKKLEPVYDKHLPENVGKGLNNSKNSWQLHSFN